VTYRFHPEALSEYDEATERYRKARAGLELRFLEAVETAITRVCETPERWRKFDGEIRRYLVHVFPYAILYALEPQGFIYVIAVMHCHREPGYWKKRLQQ
jgi:toxin ParE1/3/4